MTGFVIDNEHVWGRPVAVAVAPDGSLLVTTTARIPSGGLVTPENSCGWGHLKLQRTITTTRISRAIPTGFCVFL